MAESAPPGAGPATRASTPSYAGVLVEALTRHPERDAFVAGDRRLTYRQAAETLVYGAAPIPPVRLIEAHEASRCGVA